MIAREETGVGIIRLGGLAHSIEQRLYEGLGLIRMGLEFERVARDIQGIEKAAGRIEREGEMPVSICPAGLQCERALE